MKRIFLAAVLLVGLTGCEAGEDNGNAGNNEPVDVTDLTLCDGQSPRTIEGMWQIRQKMGELKLQSTMVIEKNRTTVSNQCRMKGKTLTVQASTSSRYNGLALEIMGNAFDRKSNNEPQAQFDCEVEMNRGNFNYHFSGRCLVLETNGKSVTLVPSF